MAKHDRASVHFSKLGTSVRRDSPGTRDRSLAKLNRVIDIEEKAKISAEIQYTPGASPASNKTTDDENESNSNDEKDGATLLFDPHRFSHYSVGGVKRDTGYQQFLYRPMRY